MRYPSEDQPGMMIERAADVVLSCVEYFAYIAFMAACLRLLCYVTTGI